jgi:hypothetical protein
MLHLLTVVFWYHSEVDQSELDLLIGVTLTHCADPKL